MLENDYVVKSHKWSIGQYLLDYFWFEIKLISRINSASSISISINKQEIEVYLEWNRKQSKDSFNNLEQHNNWIDFISGWVHDYKIDINLFKVWVVNENPQPITLNQFINVQSEAELKIKEQESNSGFSYRVGVIIQRTDFIKLPDVESKLIGWITQLKGIYRFTSLDLPKNEFPKLKLENRDREYKRYPEKLRDKVVFEYLIKGKSNRWIDANVLSEDQEYSKSWSSMGILHHIGLRDAHKGFFKETDISNAIKYLSDLNEDNCTTIIKALKRYSDNLYSLYDESSIEMFTPKENSSNLLKQVGKSQYTDGVRIDQEFHSIFNPQDNDSFVSRGKARPIKILFNNKIFPAEYRYEDQSDKTIELQSIRFKKELKKEFEKVFPIPEGEFTIETGSDINHFIFSHVAVTVVDFDDFDTEIEYSEGKQFYRLHRMRERKSGVVNQAKKIFIKKHGRLFCEACEFDFTKVYGDRGKDFIEGHHTKLVSDMQEGDKTKAEDIAMLCSNCHRMIHKKPIVSVEELAVIVRKVKHKR
jgi:hypothetical protein